MNDSMKAALAAAAASALACLYFAAPAKAELADACHVGDRAKMDSCCHQYIKVHGTPLWMISSNSSCEMAVVCTPHYVGKKFVPCEILPTPIPGTKGGSNPPPPPQTYGKG
jgi:hypothetical protein